jgi:hypothetical protein
MLYGGAGAFLVFGILACLKAWTNPRLRELSVPDALSLISVGMFLGVSLGLFSRIFHSE